MNGNEGTETTYFARIELNDLHNQLDGHDKRGN
jgi:hypothetical protein